jgi:uncharacterized protein
MFCTSKFFSFLPKPCDQKILYPIHSKGITLHPVDMGLQTGKYLLSGSSGMLGAAIRRELTRRELECLMLMRSSRKGNRSSAPGVAARAGFRSVAVSLSGEVPWNPLAKPAVQHPELLEGLAGAIHLSGSNLAAKRWTPGYKREIISSRVDSTRALAVTLAALKQKPPVLLVASAVGIYGNRGDEMLDESSAPGTGFLAGLCREWEEAAQPAVEAGIRVVHLRFGVVVGTRSNPGMLARVFRIFEAGLGGRIGSGKQWMSWISLTDLVDAVFFLLEHPAISGSVNVTAPNPVTNEQFTRTLAHELHRPAVFPVPAAALRLAFGEMADEALLASTRAYPSRLTAAGFEFSHPAIDEALNAGLRRL